VLLLDRSADSFLAKRAGADAWVIKPFHDAELRAAVQGESSPDSAAIES
jgi:DNA-binding response OmpR family regulator